MKHFIKIFGLFIVISVFCINENFTYEINSRDHDEVLKSAPAAIDFSTWSYEMRGEINLCCGVLDPVSGECQVNGKVKYTHFTLRKVDGITMIKVNLELDAQLCNKLTNPVKYTVYGNSTDTISVNRDGKLLIDKSYGVLYRPDLKVCVQYLITPLSIGIMQVNLLRLYE